MVQVLYCSMERPQPGEVYCVCDDNPISRSQAFVAKETIIKDIGAIHLVESSKFLFETRTSTIRSFTSKKTRMECKRVQNAKIKSLGIRLAFPDIAHGLRAICEGDIRPFEISKQTNTKV